MELKQYGMIGGAVALVAGIGIALVKRAKNKNQPEISQVNMTKTTAKAPEVKVITSEKTEKTNDADGDKIKEENPQVKEPEVISPEEAKKDTPQDQTPATVS